MVNVDLLIKNSRNETLLTWREDAYYGACWHIPGGIVRFKESAAARIQKVAASELGASVEFENIPLAINELMAKGRNTRGHFISLLYECKLTSRLDPDLECQSGTPGKGEWAWHAHCPAHFIPSQSVYRKYIGEAA
jgi:colanic acid biosynthesis protein WcaH